MNNQEKHPNNFTLEDFSKADHETREEVVRFWKDYGQPSQMPGWMERLLTCLEKKTLAPFAICSMAQTRAEGKAYRLLLGWLIKAAGYEATPSEEMDSLGIETNQAANKSHVPTKAPVKAAEGPVPNPAEGSHHEPKVSDSPVSPATVERKNELIRQLNNPSITNAERTKTLSLIGKMNSEKVEGAILKVKKTIAERAMKAGEQKHVKA